MKKEGDKLVKVVLDNNMVFHLYASEATIHKVFSQEKFYRFADDSNDDLLISIDAIVGFEVLDDRKEKIEEVVPQVPELPVGQEG